MNKLQLCLKISFCLLMTSIFLTCSVLLLDISDDLKNQNRDNAIMNITENPDGCKVIIYQVRPLDMCVALGRLNDLPACVRYMNEILKKVLIQSVIKVNQSKVLAM
ncbi:hypothetical protein R5R35_008003 [Gryllus longicercus]|uniref:Uncharacterized protein n=1 Tax=Gryllus longicercus TaxID=2509291 RepID=A0AAN9VDI5_9ORTH